MTWPLICETPEGCTCEAPVTTPRGMHHEGCGIRRPTPTDDAHKEADR